MFVMYCVNGTSRSSLLIESVDIMYMLELNTAITFYRANKIFVVWNRNIYDIKGNVTMYSKRIKY